MTTVPSEGPAGRVPRHVWALLVLVVVVLGFAVGGSLRSALAAPAEGARSATPQAPEPIRPAAASAPASSESSASPGTPTSSTSSSAAPKATADRAAATPPAASSAATSSRLGKALPAGADVAGTGRRIVYQESAMHLWVVGDDGTVLRDYRVTGRPGWPRPGVYHVFSKAASTASPKYGVTFRWMVRFAHGHELNIGFHDIPRVMGSGRPIQSEANLGAPIGHGGCVRQRTADAKWLYGWAQVGTPVVVLR